MLAEEEERARIQVEVEEFSRSIVNMDNTYKEGAKKIRETEVRAAKFLALFAIQTYIHLLSGELEKSPERDSIRAGPDKKARGESRGRDAQEWSR
jgi:hypothetical protein